MSEVGICATSGTSQNGHKRHSNRYVIIGRQGTGFQGGGSSRPFRGGMELGLQGGGQNFDQGGEGGDWPFS